MSRITKLGLFGTFVTALCCFTPVLTILLGVLSLSWLLGYLDYVLLPALAGFIAMTIYSVIRKR